MAIVSYGMIGLVCNWSPAGLLPSDASGTTSIISYLLIVYRFNPAWLVTASIERNKPVLLELWARHHRTLLIQNSFTETSSSSSSCRGRKPLAGGYHRWQLEEKSDVDSRLELCHFSRKLSLWWASKEKRKPHCCACKQMALSRQTMEQRRQTNTYNTVREKRHSIFFHFKFFSSFSWFVFKSAQTLISSAKPERGTFVEYEHCIQFQLNSWLIFEY